MKLTNQTRNSTISSHVEIAKTLGSRMLGELKFNKAHALFIQTRFGIHTFGMKFPIDVIVMDDKNHIVAINKNMLPNRVYLWNPKWKTILELPSDSIEKSKSKIGDTLEIE